MKEVILSADGPLMVYSVPDKVAENLGKYCCAFCDEWLQTSPHAQKYRSKNGVCYNEGDFIDYLNTWVFPNEPSTLIENLGFLWEENIPRKYQNCPRFNF